MENQQEGSQHLKLKIASTFDIGGCIIQSSLMFLKEEPPFFVVSHCHWAFASQHEFNGYQKSSRCFFFLLKFDFYILLPSECFCDSFTVSFAPKQINVFSWGGLQRRGCAQGLEDFTSSVAPWLCNHGFSGSNC